MSLFHRAPRVADSRTKGRDSASVDLELLKQFVPLGQLSPEALDELRRKAQVRELAAGSRLFVQGRDDSRVFYLLQGQLEIVDQAGTVSDVKAGSDQSLHPLAPARPRRATATASSPIRYLSIDADLLEVLSPTDSESSPVQEIAADDGQVENRIFYRVYEDYMADRLEVPSLSDVAIRVREAVQDPEVGPGELARIVQADPSLVAHLVRIANSALYTGTAPADNIRDAIVRIGLLAARDQIIGFTLKNVFQSRFTFLEERMRAIWRQSSLVGAIAFVLAKAVRGLNPEQALLGGLVQDIGTSVLLTHVGAHPELMANRQQMEATLRRLRGQVGAMVLRKWSFPDELVNIPLESECWDRDSGPKVDLCDVILLAQLHAYMSDSQADRVLPAIDSLPAYRKLDQAQLTPTLSLQVVEEARNEVAEIQSSLVV